MVESDQPHVAVLAFPFGSHAAPLLDLASRLAASAPDVSFSFFSTAKSNASIFVPKARDGGFVNIKAYDVEDGVPENHVWSGNPQEEIGLFIKATPDNFKKGLEIAVKERRKKISCLMSDAFFWFAAEMAEEMGISWVPLWTAGACSLSTHLYTDLIRKKFGAGNNGGEDEALNFIPGLSDLRLKDLQPEIIGGNLESYFSRTLYRMSQILPRATAIALNSFESLDPPIIYDLKSKFQQCLTVGPSTLTSSAPSSPSDHDETGCLSWLNDRKSTSVVYISFGTVSSLPPNELAALAEGLEASRLPYLWSLKDEQKLSLPNGFVERTSERGMVVPWVPQSRVLQHPSVGVFVTHCGWNSLLESITGGVPMICRPFFGDQKLNGALVSDVWGIGVRVSNGVFTKDAVISALETILSEEDGKKMREKVLALHELAKEAVGPKGSSTKNFNTLLGIVAKSRKCHIDC